MSATNHQPPMKHHKLTPDEYRRRIELDLYEHNATNRRIPTAAHFAIDCLCVTMIAACMAAIWLMIF